jgi:hypothetical protein
MKAIKPLLFVVLLFCASIVLQGQVGKGKLLLSGSSDFSLTVVSSKVVYDGDSDEGDNETSLNFSPQIGYFLTDGLAVGVQIPISVSSSGSGSDKYSTSTLAFAPFVRNYFGKTNLRPFVQGSAGIGSAGFKFGSDDESASLFLWEVGGGVAMFIKENISIDFVVGYVSSTMKFKDEDDFKVVSNGVGFSIGFGIIL